MLNLKRSLSLVLLSGLLALVAPLNADTLVWTLQNVTFSDGTAVTGTFTYDAAVDDYANWNLVVDAASFMPAYNYMPGVDGGFLGIHSGLQADFVAFPVPPPPSGRYLRLFFQTPLTDAGGTVDLALGGLSYECDNCVNQRLITNGSVAASAVPEPAGFALLSVVLLVCGMALRQHRVRG